MLVPVFRCDTPGPVLEAFLQDLDVVRAGTDELPVRSMLIRWKRSWSEQSLPVMLMARPKDSILRVYLYPTRADKSARPVWWFFVDPLSEVDNIAQGSECIVTGHLAPGRAVQVSVGDVQMLSTSPLRNPLRGPKLNST